VNAEMNLRVLWNAGKLSSGYTTSGLSSGTQHVRPLLVTAIVVPSSPILLTLMKEALSSSETSVLIRATRRNIPKYAILHSHRRENFKSYIALISIH
jgi:hypothetical protein